MIDSSLRSAPPGAASFLGKRGLAPFAAERPEGCFAQTVPVPLPPALRPPHWIDTMLGAVGNMAVHAHLFPEGSYLPMRTTRYHFFAIQVSLAALLMLSAAAGSPAAQKSPNRQWEGEIRAFEAADKKCPPPQGAILFIGSSGIRLWKTLAKDFPEYPVINRGFGGSQIADSVYYAERIILPYKPRLIVLRAGGNDIAAGKTPERVADDFRAFVEKVRAKLPETRICYMAFNQTPARWQNAGREKRLNQLVQEYIACHENLDYIDAASPMLGADGKPRPELLVKDRLHCNADGYKVWTKIVRPYLK